MVRFNNARKVEFAEAQSKLRSDSLEAARIAYVTGTATETQLKLIEQAAEKSAASSNASQGGDGFKLPPILGPPMAAGRTTRETLAETNGTRAEAEAVNHAAAATSGGFWTEDGAAVKPAAVEPPKESSVGFFGSLFGSSAGKVAPPAKEQTSSQTARIEGTTPAQPTAADKKKGWW